ncbi:glycosyl hydrolase 5 family protein-like [Impatiens glandulifera]|uniref:glycosyl hydrolase 5 family protein-like n=1 Tax=Impatiens glandulifera TaxID=253017 RepID=UPI001FB17588|nr:glycosyl hydrolase 5 family protein-like [Impatiens glandulifera]
MVPEGLEKQPLTNIVASVVSFGFNCVRLTWATYMYTRNDYSNLTIAQSLDKFGLNDAKAGFAKNNPDLLQLTGIGAQQVVVRALGAQNVVVILDNHLSLPQWCCSGNDGNGFFGDTHFDPNEWILGLTLVARQYKNNPTVVGMSMRNELRGSRSNEDDWYKYMEQGANSIHNENPDLLIVVSGLRSDTNLAFLKKRPFGANVGNKLVFEAHWYPFGESYNNWLNKTNQFCGTRTGWFNGQSGFLVDGGKPFPLFLSEFGIDQRGDDEMGDRYLNCLLAVAAEKDLDWAWWALQGSYMLRQGKIEMEEFYGNLDFNWSLPRNPTIQKKLQFLQHVSQDPNSKKPTSYIMYHPQSGNCVHASRNLIRLGDCNSSSRWNHDGDGSPIRLASTNNLCLLVTREGGTATLKGDCTSPRAMWRSVSGSRLHLAANGGQGMGDLCLDGTSLESSSRVLTKKCLCLGKDSKDLPTCPDNPQVQWFKLVPTNT